MIGVGDMLAKCLVILCVILTAVFIITVSRLLWNQLF